MDISNHEYITQAARSTAVDPFSASDANAPPEAIPAAAGILLRQRPDGIEVLLLQRHLNMRIYPGAWSFPGGKIEAQDRDRNGGVQGWIDTARRAALREVREETGLELEERRLVLHSRWLTPSQLPLRFTTWFFVTEATAGPLNINPDESTAHRWYPLAEALQARDQGTIVLPPPTYVLLRRLQVFAMLSELLQAIASAEALVFRPRLVEVPGGRCFLYEADSAYADGALEKPGRRHRLWALDSGWRYQVSEP